jgi:hypothetical protein
MAPTEPPSSVQVLQNGNIHSGDLHTAGAPLPCWQPAPPTKPRRYGAKAAPTWTTWRGMWQPQGEPAMGQDAVHLNQLGRLCQFRDPYAAIYDSSARNHGPTMAVVACAFSQSHLSSTLPFTSQQPTAIISAMRNGLVPGAGHVSCPRKLLDVTNDMPNDTICRIIYNIQCGHWWLMPEQTTEKIARYVRSDSLRQKLGYQAVATFTSAANAGDPSQAA